MTKLITHEDLEHFTDAELYVEYIHLLNDMARLHRSVPKCPVKLANIATVRHELLRRKMQWL